MTLTVHHLQVSQSERIPWLCEELGIPYEIATYPRNPVLAPPELKALSVMGAAPVLTDTSAPYSTEKPLQLAESGAIAEYICQKYGNGRLMLTPTHPEYADYLYWWHFSNGNLQPSFGRVMVLQNLQRQGHLSSDAPMAVRMYDRQKTMLKHMDDQLAKGPWLSGQEFTVADVMSMFTMTTMRHFGPFSLEGYDNILAWLQRCAARPAYQSARRKGDPDLDLDIDAKGPSLIPAFR